MLFFFNDTATTEIYTLSLHDALPISARVGRRLGHQLLGYGEFAGYAPLRKAIAEYLALSRGVRCDVQQVVVTSGSRSEEHTSELQSQSNLVCRLLLETKKE